MRIPAFWFSMLLLGVSPAVAASIDTAFLEQPWPRQWVRDYEVGKYPVRWRQKPSAREGLFAGAAFVTPTPPQQTWTLATDYSDLGTMTPGVSAVRFLENTPTRQVIQIDVKVLWKQLQLTFEVEQEAPRVVRFRLVNQEIGEYRGVCVLSPEGQATRIELATWLKPVVRVPSGLVLWVERVVLLRGIRNFLEACEHTAQAGGNLTPTPHSRVGTIEDSDALSRRLSSPSYSFQTKLGNGVWGLTTAAKPLYYQVIPATT